MQQAKDAYHSDDWARAERLCRQILNAEPDCFEALNLLGIIAAQTQRSQVAVELLSKAILVNPTHAMVHSNLGNVLHELKRYDQALESYDSALRLKPANAETLYSRSGVMGDLMRYEEALQSCDSALRVRPNYAEALNNRGNALGCLTRSVEALESFDRALEIKPDYAEAWNNRGAVLRNLKRHQDALESYDNALTINPGYTEAMCNRGIVLCELKRHEDALESYDNALKMNAEYAEAMYNRGIVLSELKRSEDAVEAYEQALRIKPDYAEAHWNLSLCRLQQGDFSRGWVGHEWRWRVEQLKISRPAFPQPLWLGAESLEGKTILLHSEAGLGDALQFCRYATLVAARGARVVLQVQASLQAVLAGLDGTAQVLPQGASLPAFDYHCPLMSLPLVFKTDLNSIPVNVPYIHSDAIRVAAWQDRLGNKVKPRVGLVWSGNTQHKNDQNRSLAFPEVLPLLGDWAEWICLQKEVRENDAALLARSIEVRHFGDQLKDFADTAALVELMDVVLTVDTSVAHLAGAMGKAVWILLPFNPDWRWLLNRDDSPWYPTARLFRQPAPGDWASVIESSRDALLRQHRPLGALA